MIESVVFRYSVKRYGKKLEELSTKAQFTAPVVVSGQRILRTRAKFDYRSAWPTSTRSWWTGTSCWHGWRWAAGASGSATGGRRRAAAHSGG